MLTELIGGLTIVPFFRPLCRFLAYFLGFFNGPNDANDDDDNPNDGPNDGPNDPHANPRPSTSRFAGATGQGTSSSTSVRAGPGGGRLTRIIQWFRRIGESQPYRWEEYILGCIIYIFTRVFWRLFSAFSGQGNLTNTTARTDANSSDHNTSSSYLVLLLTYLLR